MAYGQPNTQIPPQIIEEARRRGLSVEAYVRMSQGPAAMQPAANLPQQRPFAQGGGPGNANGAGQGQQGFGQQPGIGAQVAPAGYPGGDPSMTGQEAPDTSIFGQIKSWLNNNTGGGGVPFGQRLTNVGAILSAAADPQGRSLAPTLNAVADRFTEQQNTADQKAAYYADLEKQQAMAKRIYDNLKDTNPVMAELILSNPSLTKNYMEGQLDIEKTRTQESIRSENAGKLQTQQDEAAMAREVYKTENDPKALQLKQERQMWDEFKASNDLEGSATDDIYKKWTKDETLTPVEAKRLADANMRGGLTALDEEYGQVLDDRDNKAQTTIAEKAAALAGIKLKDGQYIVNQDELIASGGKIKPIVAWAEGTAEADALKAKEVSDWRTDAVDYLATTRAIDAIDKQLDPKGDTWTGAGTTAYAKMLPETNARELGNALTSLNAGNAFQKLAEIRAANATGAGVGNVTEGEYPILTAAEGEKFDQYQEPQLLRNRLMQHKNIQTAFMAESPNVGADGKKISVLQQLVNDLRASPTPEHMQEFDQKFGSGYSALVLNRAGDIPQ
jgi:hypothetical protein